MTYFQMSFWTNKGKGILSKWDNLVYFDRSDMHSRKAINSSDQEMAVKLNTSVDLILSDEHQEMILFSYTGHRQLCLN